MSHKTKLSTTLAVLALAAAALAGCTATSPTAVQTSNDSDLTVGTEGTPKPESTEPETCSSASQVYGDGGGL